MKNGTKHDRCGECWGYLMSEDNYCRKCGTKRGDGAFDPRKNIMQVLYGPRPAEFNFFCKSCGFEWKENLMLNNNHYCPKCGKKNLEVTKELENW